MTRLRSALETAPLARPTMRRLPMIFQAQTTECALACIAMVAHYFGYRATIGELRERFGASLRGLSLREVVRIADEIGIASRPIRCDLEGLRLLARPALLHWDLEHFVVLKAIRRGSYVVLDPARGELFLNRSAVSCHFTGVAVELTPKPSLSGKTAGRSLSLLAIARSAQGLLKPAFHVLGLTLAAELLALAAPVFTRVVVDHALGPRPPELLLLLCGAFTIAVLFQSCVTTLRDYSVLRAGSSFSFQMVSALMNHLMKLPLSFFECRQIGDLNDRYQAVSKVRDLLLSSIPLTILDGFLAVLSLSLVAVVSPTLALVSASVFFAYLLVRIGTRHGIRMRTESVLHHRGQESGYFIESLRCILPIKTSARELERWAVWVQKYVGLINAERGLSVSLAAHNGVRILLVNADIGLSLYVGSSQVMDGQLSVGLLLALLMYKSHFSARALSLVERGIELSMAGVHVGRLSDVALAEPEQLVRSAQRPECKYTGAMRISGVSFRYSGTDPFVFRDLICTINPGDFVAIIGKTGAGKTTLIKLLLGLYRPTTGAFEFNGSPPPSLAFHRRQFGVVLQDDQLLVGTIAENIAFFDPQIDMTRIVECARAACIDDEIMQMPMRYTSRVGEMGSALSGGQRQRLLIARALYRNPPILLFDEGTANLDPATERQVLNNLERLSSTRVFITHSKEVRKRASRVLVLADGRLTEAVVPEMTSEG